MTQTDDARGPQAVPVRYTNWKGVTSDRRLILGDVRFGSTEWHPEPTYLIRAYDLDHPAQIWKDFDLTKCDFPRADLAPTPQDARVTALVEALRRLVANLDEGDFISTTRIEEARAALAAFDTTTGGKDE